MPLDIDHAAAIDIHLFAYVQATDPGTVGAGKGWVDNTTTPYILRVRNASDTTWVDVGLTSLPAHKNSHVTGGTDPFVSGDLLDATARVGVRKNTGGSLVGSRREINLIEGSGVTLTVADNAGAERVDVTVAMTGSGSGTVTSVGMTVPSFLAVAGSPITTAGTLAVTLATQTANTLLAGPTTGGAAAPTFRTLVAADIPAISLTAGVSGVLPPANGGTGVNNGTNALTVPATGTAALRGVDNAFTVGQGIRTTLASAAGIDVPWQSGDTATAGFFGGLAVGNDQVGVTAESDSNTALFAASNSGLGLDVISTDGWGARILSVNGHGVVAYSQGPGIPLYALRQNTGTGGLYEGHIVDVSVYPAVGTPINGYGGQMTWALQDSTTLSVPASYWTVYWLNATHLSNASAVGIQVSTGGASPVEVLQISGTAIKSMVPYQFPDASTQKTGIKEAEIDFGTALIKQKTFTITDASITSTSKIIVVQSGAAATGRQADENELSALVLRALPGSGQFTLYADANSGTSPLGVNGKFKINYVASA